MSIMEKQGLDMGTVLLRAYELGDLILASEEAAQYWHWKTAVFKDKQVESWMVKLQQKKELFEECQRFGHFHPEYHRAMEAVKEVQDQLDLLPVVQRFKRAEEQLDQLLYEVSEIIAHSVSDSVKVPSNKVDAGGGGCSSGGSCSGKCG